MTGKERSALREKRMNCIRAIEVAANGLVTATKEARSWRGGASVAKKIADRLARLNELQTKLAALDAQMVD